MFTREWWSHVSKQKWNADNQIKKKKKPSSPHHASMAPQPSRGMNAVSNYTNAGKTILSPSHVWKSLLKAFKRPKTVWRRGEAMLSPSLSSSLSISFACFCCSTFCERSSLCTPSLLLYFFSSLSLCSFALCALPLSPSSFPSHTVVCRHAGIWASKW